MKADNMFDNIVDRIFHYHAQVVNLSHDNSRLSNKNLDLERRVGDLEKKLTEADRQYDKLDNLLEDTIKARDAYRQRLEDMEIDAHTRSKHDLREKLGAHPKATATHKLKIISNYFGIQI